jgi:putative ATP-binding cassette transporter
LGGLWSAGSGRIERPADDHLVFLPQQPYMVIGNLRRQMLYPDRGQQVEDAVLMDLLERVHLADLPGRFDGLDTEKDWAKVLSVGEQQRLAFTRVLLAQPVYAMLDEATSALDAANEARLYEQLALAGITPVSVSHRPGILRFHRHVLWLPGDGRWERHDAASWSFPQVDR